MSTTTARFVVTVDEFMELIDAAVEGLLPQAYAAHRNGDLPSPREFVSERASLIAGVVNIESDDILGLLISLGHAPTISNDDAQAVVEVALARALTQAMSEDRLNKSVLAWREKAQEVLDSGTEARNLESAMALANGALTILADLYDFALRCGARRDGVYAGTLRDVYAAGSERIAVEDEKLRELNALHLSSTIAQVLGSINAAGGPSAFMGTVVRIEMLGGEAAA